MKNNKQINTNSHQSKRKINRSSIKTNKTKTGNCKIKLGNKMIVSEIQTNYLTLWQIKVLMMEVTELHQFPTVLLSCLIFIHLI